MNKYILPAALSLCMLACNNPEKTPKTEVEVEKTTAFPLSNIDTTVSPCNDFYQYAIGGWLKDNPIPSTESRWSSFNVVTDSNNAKLKKIFAEFATKEFDKGSIEQKVGDFYKSVMDSTKADELGITPLQAMFDELAKIENIADYIKLNASWKEYGIGSFNGVYVGQDDKKSDEYITYLSQAGLGLPDEAYYTKSDEKAIKIQEAYKTHLSKMFTLIGDENTEGLASKVYAIEEALAHVSMTRVERRNPESTYNKLNIDELSKIAGNINWETYFKTIGLSTVEHVVVGQPNFMKGLNELLLSVPLEDWKAYSRWKLIDSYASDLSSAFVNQNFDFYNKTLSGTEVMKSREERALR